MMSDMSISGSFCISNDVEESVNDSSTSLDKYSRLRIFLRNAIEDMSSGVGEEQYVQLLGSLSIMRKSKSLPRKFQEKIERSLTESLTTEIEEMINIENIQQNLQKLEKLTDESILQEGQKLWRPNGNVKDHMRSHLMEVKLKHRNQLEKRIREKEQDLECNLRKLVRLRTQVRTLESRLHEVKSQCEDSSVVDSINEKIIDKVEELH